ncbi:YceI family protein [Luethyella okanaganae]|uniref:YceI family protein n=1 Tax=Luethyella okanaganae TaxID=69372 RepID=A0ABW1VA08_9MICO
MQKRTIVWVSVVAGALLLGGTVAVAGPLVYRDLIVGPADPAPTVQATAPAVGSGMSVDDLSGTWKVGGESFAGYRVDEVLNGTDVTVVGRTSEVSGTLEVDGLTLTGAEIAVDVASITTDQPNRDAFFRDSTMHVSSFPTATFQLTEPVTASSSPTNGEVQTVTVAGELTLRGETRPVTAELQAVFSGDGGQVSGSIPIAFADFGIEAPNLGFVSVGNAGSIEFLLDISPA